MSYVILSLDGGGVRGIISGTVLKRLAERVPIMKVVDLLAGTSTGALIALGLASGMDPLGMVDLYQRHAGEIFSRSRWRAVTSLGGLVRAKYDNRQLRRVLEAWFPPGLRLGDLRHRIVVPAFQLADSHSGGKPCWRAVVFHNFPGSPHLDELVIDVAMRTTAAPTFFPSYQGYVDGGVAANDPTIVAIAMAIHRGVAPSELEVINLGTGKVRKSIGRQRADWGLVQWLPHIVQLILDAQADIGQLLCENILSSDDEHPAPVRGREHNARLAELVWATGAGKLGPEALAGLLLTVIEETRDDPGRMAQWRERGSAFLQGASAVPRGSNA
jgi:patatin-like phospholipase/acyl hydrolase